MRTRIIIDEEIYKEDSDMFLAYGYLYLHKEKEMFYSLDEEIKVKENDIIYMPYIGMLQVYLSYYDIESNVFKIFLRAVR